MILKMNKILNLYDLLERLSSEKYEVATSYKIVKLFKRLEIEKEIFHSEMQKTFDEFVEKDENGNFVIVDKNQYKIIKGKEKDAQERMDSLFLIDVDLDVNLKFSLDEFTTMAPKDLFLLEPFLDNIE